MNRFVKQTLTFALAAALSTITAVRAEEAGHQHEGHDPHAHHGGTAAESATEHSEQAGHEHEGHDPHAHHKATAEQPAKAESPSSDIELLDRALKDQEGDTVRFKSDVVGDNIVVMDFVYTTCTTVCPVLTTLFAKLQDSLGERLGQDVKLVSISVDPTRDTPQRLKAHAGRYHAKPGWVWLTGEKPAVDEVLNSLGAYTPDFTQHPSMVLVGDPRSGNWTRYYGFPSPDKIRAKVDELLATRQRSEAK